MIKRAFTFALAISLLTSTFTFADVEDLTVQTGCSEVSSYTGVLNLSRGTYDVYVKLAKRGESAKVTVYTQSGAQSYGECTNLQTLKASGNKWTKAGVFSVSQAQQYTLELASPVLADVPDANRPAIMLVPRENPICIPKVECLIDIDGQQGYVRPVGTLFNQDSLRVVKVVDPAKDTIQQVRYYADNALVYTSSQLESFDPRFIEYSGQKLARVVVYGSGQQVVLESKAPAGHVDTFTNFVFRLSQKYPDTLITILWVSVILLASAALLLILSMVRRRRAWDRHHGLIKETPENKWQKLLHSRGAILGARIAQVGALLLALAGGVMLVIIGVNTYLLQIIYVDGHSMEKSYFTGDRVFVNKIPKTLADLNGTEYVPERGQVVIVRASFGNTFFTDNDTTNLSLIKRVIALPGERVVIQKGILTVYNRSHPDGFQPDAGSSWQKNMTPDEKTEKIDIQLETSEIFVSGDNRPASIDSRFNGPISTREVLGVVAGKL